MHGVLRRDDHEGRRDADPGKKVEKQGGENHSNVSRGPGGGHVLARPSAGVYRANSPPKGAFCADFSRRNGGESQALCVAHFPFVSAISANSQSRNARTFVRFSCPLGQTK